MNEDKDIGPSDTPVADDAEQWLRQRNREQPKSIGEVNPQKEGVKNLFSLGSQVLEIAQKIDWENRDYREEVIRGLPMINTVVEGNRIELMVLDLRDQAAELQLDGQEIKSIQFSNSGFYWLDWTKQYFGDAPVYGVALHSPHEGGYSGHKYTYAFTEKGDCVKRTSFWQGDSVKNEYTEKIGPGEIDKVDVAMRMLKAQLGEIPSSPKIGR